jgi:hypothetical protein
MRNCGRADAMRCDVMRCDARRGEAMRWRRACGNDSTRVEGRRDGREVIMN